MRNDIDAVIRELEELDDQFAQIKRVRDGVYKELSNLLRSSIEEKLKDRPYNCGTTNIESDVYKVKATVSKKVSWDQEKLKEVSRLIKEGGQNPAAYIKTKLDVSESVYKTWPDDIQRVFLPAREVKQSATKIEYERKENADN